MGQVHTPTTTHPQSTPPPFVHPKSATAQLGLTTEEANKVHEECIRAQEELQEEMQREDHKREAKWNGYPPLPKHQCTTRQVTMTRTSCHLDTR